VGIDIPDLTAALRRRYKKRNRCIGFDEGSGNLGFKTPSGCLLCSQTHIGTEYYLDLQHATGVAYETG